MSAPFHNTLTNYMKQINGRHYKNCTSQVEKHGQSYSSSQQLVHRTVNLLIFPVKMSEEITNAANNILCLTTVI